MATFLSTASTVIHRDRMGHSDVVTAQYAATTAAGSDTVDVPGLSQVYFVNANWVFSASTAPSTVHFLAVAPSTRPGAIIVWNSTHDNFNVRYQAFGR